MYKKVDTWFDIVAQEHEILKLWEETDAFEKLRAKNANGEIWSFLDGPITANNPMGIHHAWGRTLKDAYQRYHAMNGKKLRYQNGFDCQGLWVEVEVEKELGFKNKQDIEAFGIGPFVEKCKERVRKYSAIQTEQSIRLGYWMDWNDSYYTMDDENNYTIWKFLKKCHDRGLIYLGKDVMPWCARCGTGISQHEMHEGYKVVKDVSVFVRFPVAGRKDEYFLVWTTTPWTLSSNTAIALNKKLTYAKVEQDGATYYFSAALVPPVMGRKGEYKILETMPGASFKDWHYKGAYDENENQKVEGPGHPVIFWEAVAEEEGTGIVHIAPGCGKEDFDLGKEFGLPVIAPLDEQGIFLEGFGFLTGKGAAEAAPEILEDLKNKGVLYASEKYEHSYPHCWRCGTPLLFRAVDEWFISMDPWREEIKEIARQIRWIPGYGLDLELDWLSNMRDWMISKKRYWGLALPIWVCEDCGGFEVIGDKRELEKSAVEGWDEFEGHSPHRPWVDAVKIACKKCGGTANRIKDVGNPWLDAGIVPYSTTFYNSSKEEWKKWFPAHLVLECFSGQFRNWFYAMLAMSTMMENIPPFRTLLGHALVRDEQGEEMHKSAGNAIWFDEAAEKIGVDVMRWLYCRHETTTNLNFGYGLTKEIRGKFINTYWNTCAFFVNYARIAGFVPASGEPAPLETRPAFDRWILDRLARALERSRKGFDDYNLRQCLLAAEEFIEDLSNWYIRHNRRRFWGELSDPDVLGAFETLFTCLEQLTLMIAPVMPFLTEAVYQNMVRAVTKDAPESVHLCDYPRLRPEWRDDALAEEMGTVARVTHLVLSARETARLRVRQPLAGIGICPQTEKEAQILRDHADFLAKNLNVKKTEILKPGAANPATTAVKPNFKTLGKKLGPKMKPFADWLSGEGGPAVSEKLKGDDEGFSLDFQGETLDLTPDDFLTEMVSPEGTFVAADGFNWISLDTKITPELAREGAMRDVLRKLQITRKDVGLEIEDRCAVVYATEDENLSLVMSEWKKTIMDELLCLDLSEGDPGENPAEIKIADALLLVKLRKANA